jgi:hypothetical protein
VCVCAEGPYFAVPSATCCGKRCGCEDTLFLAKVAAGTSDKRSSNDGCCCCMVLAAAAAAFKLMSSLLLRREGGGLRFGTAFGWTF